MDDWKIALDFEAIRAIGIKEVRVTEVVNIWEGYSEL